MARQVNNLFLEEWLRNSSGSDSNTITSQPSVSSPLSSRSIIQAWAELRDCLQRKSFQPNHLQSLKMLLSSRISLHVADPQAKLLLSILSSPDLIIPLEAYPLMIRLLYIWVRKSFRPSLLHIDLAVEVFSKLFGGEYGSKRTPELFSQGVLILGALSFVSSISEKSRTVCLDLLCRLLVEDLSLVKSFDELVPDVLAGIGYSLCSSNNVYYVKILDSFFGMWEVQDGIQANVTHGLMILHLVEWVISGFIKANSQKKLVNFAEVLESSKGKYGPFAHIMASGGILRALNKYIPSGQTMEIISRLRVSSENLLEYVAHSIISKTSEFSSPQNDPITSLLLTCMSLALARGGSVSARPPFLISLAFAMLKEIFPLRHVYLQIFDPNCSLSAGMGLKDIKKHLNSVPFKEAGAITGVFCSQYVSTDEDNKAMVENMMWKFCQELYLGHRQAALLLRDRDSELLGDIEKVAESAFLMVVVFALAVTKHKLNSKLSNETQLETSVSILISFSCVEYFRRIRLPEYLETIRGVVVSAQENEAACISFVESMPSYTDITKPQDLMQKMEYNWFKDDMQTARILFYLRVIPTCMHLPLPVFSRVVASTMFLYLGHPNRKVAQASHSLFAAFMSSDKSSDQSERALLKEQLSFYYIQMSLEGYPNITPFEGMASGIVALVRNVPAGSPAAFYCIHSLVEKAQSLCTNDNNPNADIWKNWSGEAGPSKKLLELLLRLIALVDIQVLPSLMKLLAQLIIQLPKVGQNVVLDELYVQVAESDDVTRKPALVSWLQSLSYLSHQVTSKNVASKGIENKKSPASSHEGLSSWDGRCNRVGYPRKTSNPYPNPFKILSTRTRPEPA